jgi:hypothetical protein
MNPASLRTPRPWGAAAAVAALLSLGAPAAAQPVKAASVAQQVAAAAWTPALEVRAAQPVRGQLTPADSVLEDKSYADVWTYRGRAGERVTATLVSPDFDAYLMLVRPVGGEMMGADDDGGGGTSARVVADLLADGEYTLVVNSVQGGETGAYTLTVESSPTRSAVTTTMPNSPQTPNWDRMYPGGGDPDERYALLVGIEEYPEGVKDLDGPAADVRVTRDLLVNRYGFHPENIVTITDREANREHVVNAALRHLGQAGPNGVAVFYYSGHGTQLDGNFGATGALDDEDDGKDEAIVMWGRGDRTAVLLDDELGYLSERLAAGRAMFILDACHSGTGIRGTPDHYAKFVRMEDVGALVDLPETYLTAPGVGEVGGDLAAGARPQRRRVLLAASSADEVSWVAAVPWLNGSDESVFTHYLVQHLKEAPQTETFESLLARVGRQTAQYTRNRFRKLQTPQVEGAEPAEMLDTFLRKR